MSLLWISIHPRSLSLPGQRWNTELLILVLSSWLGSQYWMWFQHWMYDFLCTLLVSPLENTRTIHQIVHETSHPVSSLQMKVQCDPCHVEDAGLVSCHIKSPGRQRNQESRQWRCFSSPFIVEFVFFFTDKTELHHCKKWACYSL